jgi:hypothetical protein
MIISINQINDLLEAFTNNHLFLNSYGIGSTSEIGVSRQLKFPYLWCTFGENTTIQVQNNTTIPSLDLTIIVADQKNIQETGDDFNVLENLSDCFQIQQDLVTTITTEWGKWGIKISGDVRLYPVIDETQDAVNGWALELKLKLNHHNCTIPTRL